VKISIFLADMLVVICGSAQGIVSGHSFCAGDTRVSTRDISKTLGKSNVFVTASRIWFPSHVLYRGERRYRACVIR